MPASLSRFEVISALCAIAKISYSPTILRLEDTGRVINLFTSFINETFTVSYPGLQKNQPNGSTPSGSIIYYIVLESTLFVQ